MIYINTYYKNQKDIASALKTIIDNYWENEINEELMIDKINSIIENNKDKVYADGNYSKIIQHKCGKKRMDLIDKIKRGESN